MKPYFSAAHLELLRDSMKVKPLEFSFTINLLCYTYVNSIVVPFNFRKKCLTHFFYFSSDFFIPLIMIVVRLFQHIYETIFFIKGATHLENHPT